MNAETYLSKIETLLDRERVALLAGQLDTVNSIAAEKNELRSETDLSEAPSPAQLKRLKDKADRNQRLFQSALKGVRAVAERLKSFRQNGGSLNTYGRDGARQTTGSAISSSIEKRA